MTVPIEAVLDNGDGTGTVMRGTADNTVEAVTVELGLENDLNIQLISSALQPGDLLILSPEGITEGMTVAVQTV